MILIPDGASRIRCDWRWKRIRELPICVAEYLGARDPMEHRFPRLRVVYPSQEKWEKKRIVEKGPDLTRLNIPKAHSSVSDKERLLSYHKNCWIYLLINWSLSSKMRIRKDMHRIGSTNQLRSRLPLWNWHWSCYKSVERRWRSCLIRPHPCTCWSKSIGGVYLLDQLGPGQRENTEAIKSSKR